MSGRIWNGNSLDALRQPINHVRVDELFYVILSSSAQNVQWKWGCRIGWLWNCTVNYKSQKSYKTRGIMTEIIHIIKWFLRTVKKVPRRNFSISKWKSVSVPRALDFELSTLPLLIKYIFNVCYLLWCTIFLRTLSLSFL